jgi:hypothetical protein
LLGAIAAWFGLALIQLLSGLQLLGNVFNSIQWDGPPDVMMVGLGFTLGFSERLFTSLLAAVEGGVDDALPKGKPGSGPATSGPAAGPTAPVGGGTPPPNGVAPPAAGHAAPQVTLRIAVDDAATLEAGSLQMTVDDLAQDVGADGCFDLPVSIGAPHVIAAKARRAGVAVSGTLSITPVLDDERRPYAITLSATGAD